MRRFAWRLERVLSVRALEAEVARGRWAAAEARANSADERVVAARARLAEGRAEVARWQSETNIDVHLVLAAQSALASLGNALRAARAVALAARAEADDRRTEWRTADRAREALARGRERARERHRAESERRETVALDETAAARAAREK